MSLLKVALFKSISWLGDQGKLSFVRICLPLSSHSSSQWVDATTVQLSITMRISSSVQSLITVRMSPSVSHWPPQWGDVHVQSPIPQWRDVQHCAVTYHHTERWPPVCSYQSHYHLWEQIPNRWLLLIHSMIGTQLSGLPITIVRRCSPLWKYHWLSLLIA